MCAPHKSIRSERMFVEQHGDKLLFGWFVDFAADGSVRDCGVLSRSGNRRIESCMVQCFLECVPKEADGSRLAVSLPGKISRSTSTARINDCRLYKRKKENKPAGCAALGIC